MKMEMSGNPSYHNDDRQEELHERGPPDVGPLGGLALPLLPAHHHVVHAQACVGPEGHQLVQAGRVGQGEGEGHHQGEHHAHAEVGALQSGGRSEKQFRENDVGFHLEKNLVMSLRLCKAPATLASNT